MRTKLVESAFVVAIAMMACINVFKAQKPVLLSDIGLENVESLADGTENSKKYKYVFFKEPGDPGYGQVACVCSGENGDLICCDSESK